LRAKLTNRCFKLKPRVDILLPVKPVAVADVEEEEEFVLSDSETIIVFGDFKSTAVRMIVAISYWS